MIDFFFLSANILIHRAQRAKYIRVKAQEDYNKRSNLNHN
ncbi:hypothetical protein ISN45_At03g032880 [Arabidopsis thaliana x Arabidopsis arenosa]|uniref:Uncharacterized protein n=1 Tax=Arabidopsis thaliana x Arabidopsis arenosa TaxID=1240361 RepID=A0A8T2ET97_9BRAS|nr:hypothetical protein ISN45_At03g032880 [Arabidopsis thaliana x Arabidopsis arenosa]